ncbi:MAG: sulfite exporter TauE/SafE family protein [Bacteroidota bacterium]
MIFLTAFLTGLLGSFHCAGMCGPIALAVPTIGKSFSAKLLSKVVYNAGRILTYAILGALLGTFGLGLKLAGLQQSISIAAGLSIILMVLFSSHVIERWVGNPFSLIKGKTIARLFQSPSLSSIFAIGLLNGLLPCGFVYLGLIGSVATQNAIEGAAFMVLFGLGTFPMMLGVGMVGQFLTAHARTSINKWVPVLAIFIGCIFIMRGLNLGIPYLSPKITSDHTTVKECCKPR